MQNLYTILGVPRDADQATIKKAFQRLAKKFHPDVNKEKAAEETFKKITAAYEVLGDEQKRALYDEFGEDSLRAGFNPDQARAFKNFRGAPGGDGGGFGGFRFEDLFGNLGGGGFGGFGGGGFGGDAGPRGARRGADLETESFVPLLDAIRGSTVNLEVTRPGACTSCHGEGGTGRKPCPVCAGRGRREVRQFGLNAVTRCDECAGEGSVYERECATCGGTGRTRATRTLSVRIPPGVTDGQVLRLKGKGGEGANGGPPGDLLLTVRVGEHPLLRRDGLDLELEVPITLTEALAGGSIEVPTPAGGRARVRVPPGSQNGQRLRLAGKGIQAAERAGDLYLVLRPMLPGAADPEALRLAAELDRRREGDVRAALVL